MISVTLVANNGAGLPVKVPIIEGTILEQFLAISFDGDPNEFTIRVRTEGVSVQAHCDYVLQDGDRVSLAPIKIDGAAGRGPGTNEEQIASLREKLGEGGEQKAMEIVNGHTPDVITLAYKLMRISVKSNKLPKNVNTMLGNLSEEDAALVREKLVSAKMKPEPASKATV